MKIFEVLFVCFFTRWKRKFCIPFLGRSFERTVVLFVVFFVMYIVYLSCLMFNVWTLAIQEKLNDHVRWCLLLIMIIFMSYFSVGLKLHVFSSSQQVGTPSKALVQAFKLLVNLLLLQLPRFLHHGWVSILQLCS